MCLTRTKFENYLLEIQMCPSLRFSHIYRVKPWPTFIARPSYHQQKTKSKLHDAKSPPGKRSFFGHVLIKKEEKLELEIPLRCYKIDCGHQLTKSSKLNFWVTARITLTWTATRLGFFFKLKPEDISKNDGNII